MIRQAEIDTTTNDGTKPKLAGDMVFLLGDQVILLWNFVNDQWTRWYTQKDVSLVSR